MVFTNKNIQNSKCFSFLSQASWLEFVEGEIERRFAMTANQINRFRALTEQQQALETKRHNIVSEGLTARDVASNEEYRRTSGSAQLSQARAANISAQASASQARTAAERQSEDARHNLALEGINRADAETRRYDAETRRQGAEESVRHNKETEAQQAGFGAFNVIETRRHNKQMEKAATTTAEAATTRADAAKQSSQAAADRVPAQNTKDYTSSVKTAAEVASMLINGGN